MQSESGRKLEVWRHIQLDQHYVLPNLRRLSLVLAFKESIKAYWKSTVMLDVLEARPGQPLVCPRLESLYVCVLRACHLHTHLVRLKRVLESRVERDSGYRLRRLALGFDAPRTEELCEVFEDSAVADEVVWVGEPRMWEDRRLSERTSEGLVWLSGIWTCSRGGQSPQGVSMERLRHSGPSIPPVQVKEITGSCRPV